MSNRLSHETSPYLLQHQHNPVDWYPWGEEALARAKKENKPILLSIGYSACHWCHVMERESFENAEIARLMNESFICVKVDREERPDLDQIYQNVAQALTRSGGWPLTVFLTPDLKPFFGGTYFPPEDRWGRPGFPRVLEALANAYRQDSAGVAENARRLTEFIRATEAIPQTAPTSPDRRALLDAAEQILNQIDWGDGGLQGAPKFPNPMVFSFLWRLGTLEGNQNLREAVLLTLEKMAAGGIYDQLGGGFHRYSVDAEWSVPHFEKMLYDNGLLLKLYSEALLDTQLSEARRERFSEVVSETVGYLIREMRDAGGGFYSAQDADSEGEEGKFFVWNQGELAAELTTEESQIFALRYGVTAVGNFEHGKTVLYLARTLKDAAASAGIGEKEAAVLLGRAREKLFQARSKRVAPGTDRKILASWNGLVISGLAWASHALRSCGLEAQAHAAWEAAVGAYGFAKQRFTRPDGKLFSVAARSNGAEQAKLNAYLDDYAFLSLAALDLARFTTNSEELMRDAGLWIETVLSQFSDPTAPGYFFTSADHESLIHRPKTIFDQAIPSGTGVVLECLAVLAETDPAGGVRLQNELENELPQLFALARKHPSGSGQCLSAALLTSVGPVLLSGNGAERAIRSALIYKKGEGPLLACHRRTCGLPAKNTDDLRREVEGRLSEAWISGDRSAELAAKLRVDH